MMLPLPNRIADQYNLTGDIKALLNWDSTIFDNMQIPEALDRELVINTILMECSERPLLHPWPEWMKWGIETWSKRMVSIWQKLYDTTVLTYNPINNYDRNDEETSNRGINRKRTAGTTYDENSSTNTTVNNNGTDTHNVSAENVDTYQPESQDVSENTSSQNGSVETSGSNDTTEIENTGEQLGRKLHSYGNIGVTTTQTMIKQEREIVVFSVYEQIANDFAAQFCLLIW